MENISIFCADIGSVKRKKFGWASKLANNNVHSGSEIEDFARYIAVEINSGVKVTIGFECPLFVPIREIPQEINSSRIGEGNRSWSASAGACSMATGLVEVIWVMNQLNNLLNFNPKIQFNWDDFLISDSIFIWEAFVTASAKGNSHIDDAKMAINCFEKALPNPFLANAIQKEEIFSIVGAAALRTGWSSDLKDLSKQCLVIKA